MTTHGKSKTKAYRHWSNLVTRATNPDRATSEKYNALGVDHEIRTFEGFYAELGDPPPGRNISVDRKDNTKGYIKGNLRWATVITQQRNKGNNRMLTLDGVTRCAAEWCEIKGISWSVLKGRLKDKWPIEEALNQPVGVIRSSRSYSSNPEAVRVRLRRLRSKAAALAAITAGMGERRERPQR